VHPCSRRNDELIRGLLKKCQWESCRGKEELQQAGNITLMFMCRIKIPASSDAGILTALSPLSHSLLKAAVAIDPAATITLLPVF
jgi:hypothetical protein